MLELICGISIGVILGIFIACCLIMFGSEDDDK